MTRKPMSYRMISLLMACVATGCGWRGVNSLPLPGTGGQRARLLSGASTTSGCDEHSAQLAGLRRRRLWNA